MFLEDLIIIFMGVSLAETWALVKVIQREYTSIIEENMRSQFTFHYNSDFRY